jgi:MtN3 and saliva related transmembrane protein
MLSGFSNQLALIAAVYGVISSLSPSLQILRMRRAGSSESLSRTYVMIGAGGYMIWFTYGLALGNVPLIVADAIGAVMQLTVLWWAFRLDDRHPSAV